MWVAVDAGWGAVSSPSCVCNTGVRIKDLGQIWLLCLNKLLELVDLANLLEREDLILLVSINGQSCRVISTVLETGKTCGVVSVYRLPRGRGTGKEGL